MGDTRKRTKDDIVSAPMAFSRSSAFLLDFQAIVVKSSLKELKKGGKGSLGNNEY